MAKKPAKTETAAAETPATDAPVADAPATDTSLPTQSNSDPILVCDELLDVIRAAQPNFAPQGSKEADAEYFGRMITVLSEIPEAEFEAMSEGAQTWYNRAGEALNEGKEVEAPEGFIPAAKQPKAAAAEKAPKAPKEPKAPKAPPPPKEPKAEGSVSKARRVVIANHTKTTEEIKNAVKQILPDLKDSTFAAVLTDTMATIRLAKELGFWKDAA